MSRWFASGRLFSAALTAIVGCLSAFADAATQPRYGGTLVVELHAPALVLDPMKWKNGAPEYADNAQIVAAVFDRLVTLDRFGRFQPALATEWSHDAASRRWQFILRPGVQFSDGSFLTAADVAAALQELLPLSQPSPEKIVVTGTGTRVTMQFPSATPDLLEQLASGRFFIYRREVDGALLGTGAFFVEKFTPAAAGTTMSHYKLAANEHCWAGRSFVDGLEVSVGVPLLRQLIDLQLGKADVVEISPDLVRRAAQENLRVWASAPVSLYALQVGPVVGRSEDMRPARAGGAKPDPGEALSMALDRATMANVLLQRQAEPASSFLPQWLSGYAFVFNSVFDGESDAERAKRMSAGLFAAANASGAPSPQPLLLRVDASGDLAKLIAERVAINARQAGIPVQVRPRSLGREGFSGDAAGMGKTPEMVGLRLVAWRYSSLSERAELDAMLTILQLDVAADDKEKGKEKTADLAEQLYDRERRLLAEHHLIPLVMVPEYIGLGSQVRDWMAERWGEWHLGDVWLDGKRTTGSPPASSVPTTAGVRP